MEFQIERMGPAERKSARWINAKFPLCNLQTGVPIDQESAPNNPTIETNALKPGFLQMSPDSPEGDQFLSVVNAAFAMGYVATAFGFIFFGGSEASAVNASLVASASGVHTWAAIKYYQRSRVES